MRALLSGVQSGWPLFLLFFLISFPDRLGELPAPPIPLEQFAAVRPECLEWADTCRVCAREPAPGTATELLHCSAPGIAREPTAMVCTLVQSP